MTDIQSICAKIEAETGVNPAFLYCSYSGQPYARLNLDALQGTDEDSLLTYSLSTMRPSPRWAGLDRDSLWSLRYSEPRALLSYFLIRLNIPNDSQSHGGLRLTQSQRMSNANSAVRIYALCQSLAVSDSQLDKMLCALAMLDADFNLSKLTPETKIKIVVDKNDLGHGRLFVKRETRSAMPPLGQLWAGGEAGVAQFIQHAVDWHDYLTVKRTDDEREAKMSREYWISGNRHAERVAADLFTTTKPVTASRLKRQAKVVKESEADQMLAAIMNVVQPSTPSTKPLGPKQAKVAEGLTMLLAIGVGQERVGQEAKASVAAPVAKRPAVAQAKFTFGKRA